MHIKLKELLGTILLFHIFPMNLAIVGFICDAGRSIGELFLIGYIADLCLIGIVAFCNLISWCFNGK